MSCIFPCKPQKISQLNFTCCKRQKLYQVGYMFKDVYSLLCCGSLRNVASVVEETTLTIDQLLGVLNHSGEKLPAIVIVFI